MAENVAQASKSMEEAKAKFAELDADSDGFLTLDELKKGLGDDKLKNIEEKFAKYDKDGSKTFKFIEYWNFMNPMTEAFEGSLRMQFKFYDRDGNGSVTVDEAKRLFWSLEQVKAKDELWDTLMEHVDTNNDGKLSFEEFKMGVQFIL